MSHLHGRLVADERERADYAAVGPDPERAEILLADDLSVVRESFRADLEELGYVICAEADDASSAVAAALRERPRLALLDVAMPGGGITAARAIAASLPETRIVMLTVSSDEGDIRAAVDAGAAGYVLKDVPIDRLAAALDAVLAGGSALPKLRHH